MPSDMRPKPADTRLPHPISRQRHAIIEAEIGLSTKRLANCRNGGSNAFSPTPSVCTSAVRMMASAAPARSSRKTGAMASPSASDKIVIARRVAPNCTARRNNVGPKAQSPSIATVSRISAAGRTAMPAQLCWASIRSYRSRPQISGSVNKVGCVNAATPLNSSSGRISAALNTSTCSSGCN